MTDKSDTPALFSRIAHRYDLLNHLLSLNADRRWRRALVKQAAVSEGTKVLDVATGTGDVAVEFAVRSQAGIVTGLDRSSGMLGRAARKFSKKRLAGRVSLVEGDALALPFGTGTFDTVTIAFGLRNLPDYSRGLVEMTRVLRTGGRLLVLEFFPPRAGLFLKVYRAYLSAVLPSVGGAVSGSTQAYRYLASSIKSFVSRDDIRRYMEEAGLVELRVQKLTGGVAYVIHGVKR